MACRLCSPRVMRAALRQLYRRQAAAGGPEAQGRARPALAARGHPPCAKPAVRAAAQGAGGGHVARAGQGRARGGRARRAEAGAGALHERPVQGGHHAHHRCGAPRPAAPHVAQPGGRLGDGRGRPLRGPWPELERRMRNSPSLTRLPCRCSTRYANLLRITAASLLQTLAGTWCPLLLLQQRARPAPTSRAARRCAARRRGVAVLHVHSRGRGHQKHARAGALTPVIFDTALCSCCLCSASICGNAGALPPRARSLACSVRSAGRTSVCSIALRVPGVRAGMPGSSRPSHAQHCQR